MVPIPTEDTIILGDPTRLIAVKAVPVTFPVTFPVRVPTKVEEVIIPELLMFVLIIFVD